METRPFFVWWSEYPDEGSMVVDAVDHDDAKRQFVEAHGPDATVEDLDAKPVTAADVRELRGDDKPEAAPARRAS